MVAGPFEGLARSSPLEAGTLCALCAHGLCLSLLGRLTGHRGEERPEVFSEAYVRSFCRNPELMGRRPMRLRAPVVECQGFAARLTVKREDECAPTDTEDWA